MRTKPATVTPENSDIFPRSTLVRAGVWLAAILLFCLNYWINRYFGTPDIDQIAYHLQFGPNAEKRTLGGRWCPSWVFGSAGGCEGRSLQIRSGHTKPET